MLEIIIYNKENMFPFRNMLQQTNTRIGKRLDSRHQRLDGKLAKENGDFPKNMEATKIILVWFLPIRGCA